MTSGRQTHHQRLRGADYCGVHIRAYSLRVDNRLGGVGGGAVLRAVRAVSSASRARGRTL